jgi:hypothetical protein
VARMGKLVTSGVGDSWDSWGLDLDLFRGYVVPVSCDNDVVLWGRVQELLFGDRTPRRASVNMWAGCMIIFTTKKKIVRFPNLNVERRNGTEWDGMV